MRISSALSAARRHLIPRSRQFFGVSLVPGFRFFFVTISIHQDRFGVSFMHGESAAKFSWERLRIVVLWIIYFQDNRQFLHLHLKCGRRLSSANSTVEVIGDVSQDEIHGRGIVQRYLKNNNHLFA